MTNKQKKTAILILGLFNLFMTPFVTMTMWNWFVTKLGVHSIGYLMAFGIVLMVDFLIYIPSQNNPLTYKNNEEAIDFKYHNAIGGTSIIVWTLVVGYLIHLFV